MFMSPYRFPLIHSVNDSTLHYFNYFTQHCIVLPVLKAIIIIRGGGVRDVPLSAVWLKFYVLMVLESARTN
jgi:hypothetical protein